MSYLFFSELRDPRERDRHPLRSRVLDQSGRVQPEPILRPEDQLVRPERTAHSVSDRKEILPRTNFGRKRILSLLHRSDAKLSVSSSDRKQIRSARDRSAGRNSDRSSSRMSGL